jgi:hypothetical protein
MKSAGYAFGAHLHSNIPPEHCDPDKNRNAAAASALPNPRGRRGWDLSVFVR